MVARDRARDILSRLPDRGVQISVDDVGTGLDQPAPAHRSAPSRSAG